jgi:membrane protein
VTERRWFLVIAASLYEFRTKKMRYFCSFFTYNGFLAALALLVAMAAFMGFLLQHFPSLKDSLHSAFGSMMPVLGGTTNQSIKTLTEYRSVVGVISFFGLMWTGTKMFNSLEAGFCQIWSSRRRSFARRKLLGMLMVTIIGTIFIVSLLVQFAFSAVWGWLVGETGAAFSAGTVLFKPFLSVAVNFGLFLFIYQVVPTVKQSLKRSAVGAVLASAAFMLSQYLISYYFGNVSKIPSMYGSIATVVVLLIWLQITGMIIFLGAEVICVLSDPEIVETYQKEARLPHLLKGLREEPATVPEGEAE